MTGILNTTQSETKATEKSYDDPEIQMFTAIDVLTELNALRDGFACLEGLFVI